ncbi:MAG: hypothetical protein A3E57_03315 [Candidatus Muproteobacteria bacterium RIFCSPHIGHO2_12_FULL_60_33]|nr:MAG: hypothetical protein A3E57_03315 [Candidatus Muproteobacteria bacterium RIFCSPHIGHO2_12_FULL_60_33]
MALLTVFPAFRGRFMRATSPPQIFRQMRLDTAQHFGVEQIKGTLPFTRSADTEKVSGTYFR